MKLCCRLKRLKFRMNADRDKFLMDWIRLESAMRILSG